MAIRYCDYRPRCTTQSKLQRRGARSHRALPKEKRFRNAIRVTADISGPPVGNTRAEKSRA